MNGSILVNNVELKVPTTFVREVTLRYKGRARKAPCHIDGPESSADFIRKVLPDNVKEHFVALFLSHSHDVAAYSIVATGTASMCPAHPREIFQPAILAGACALLVAHNHPSGSPTPSQEDHQITKRLKEAGELLGIKLLDHVIVTEREFYSFHEHSAL